MTVHAHDRPGAPRAAGPAAAVPTRATDRTTPFEIFFDLVLVFALTRVVDLVDAAPGIESIERALVVLAMLWWAWCAFIWLGNQVRLDRGFVRVGMLVAMCALFVVGVLIPVAWQEPAVGPSAALLLALAFGVVRACYVTLFTVVAWSHRRVRTQILLDLVPQGTSIGLLITGALLGGTWQTVLWALALAADFVGGRSAARYRGWRVASARHFTERHDLILIIAIGESVLAVGSQVGPNTPIPTAVAIAVLGFLIAAGLWWAFFGRLSAEGADALVHLPALERAALARDGYTFAHFPIVAGVILIALGSSLLFDEVAIDHGAPANPFAVTVLVGGIVLFLLGMEVFRWVMLRAWRRTSVVAATVALLIGVASTWVSGWAVLMLTTLLLITTSTLISRAWGTRRADNISGWK